VLLILNFIPLWPLPLHDVILAQVYVILAQVYVIQRLQHVIRLVQAWGIASLARGKPC
jgi:hypothetical protein